MIDASTSFLYLHELRCEMVKYEKICCLYRLRSEGKIWKIFLMELWYRISQFFHPFALLSSNNNNDDEDDALWLNYGLIFYGFKSNRGDKKKQSSCISLKEGQERTNLWFRHRASNKMQFSIFFSPKYETSFRHSHFLFSFNALNTLFHELPVSLPDRSRAVNLKHEMQCGEENR